MTIYYVGEEGPHPKQKNSVFHVVVAAWREKKLYDSFMARINGGAREASREKINFFHCRN